MSEAELQVCAAALGEGGRDAIDRAIDNQRGYIQPTVAPQELYVKVDVPTDDETASAPASASAASVDEPPTKKKRGGGEQTYNLQCKCA